MKNFKPCGNQVLVRWIPTVKQKPKENKTESGLILPEGVKKTANLGGETVEVDQYLFQVIGVGEDVDLEEKSFKVGDLVVFNEMDMKLLGDNDGNHYSLVRDVSIMATYETNAVPEKGWDLNKF